MNTCDNKFFSVILQVQRILQDVGSNIATPRQSSPDRNISENGFFFPILGLPLFQKETTTMDKLCWKMPKT